MSKTSERSSTTEAAARPYSRRFAGSATAFARRYREDLFYRTTVNVVFLQVGFALFLLAIVAAGGVALYQSVLADISDALARSLTEGAQPADGYALVQSLEYTRTSIIILTGTLVLIGAAVFSYLIARLALGPTRSALESQKQFISNVAHELRTPLSIIKTNAEVALFSEPEGTKTRKTLESVVDELDRISDIINNLLSLSAIIRPERMRFGPVDVLDAARHAIGSLESLAARKSLAIELSADDGLPPVWANRGALEQIVMNLVKNAVNYTREGGPPVSVRIRAVEGSVRITVEDQGAGIPESDLPRILEPFYRGDPSRTRRSTGSGLGLTIVNELLKTHEGTMRIKSTLGRGTEVAVTLPTLQGIAELAPLSAVPKDEVSVDFSRTAP